MSKETPIKLNDRQLAYAHRKVEAGEFGSVDDVIQDALSRAEARDARIERLRELVREGEESGTPKPLDFDEFLREMRYTYKGAA